MKTPEEIARELVEGWWEDAKFPILAGRIAAALRVEREAREEIVREAQQQYVDANEARIEAETVLRKIIGDGVELSIAKVVNQRDYFQKLAREYFAPKE